jgi:hypothetical protein
MIKHWATQHPELKEVPKFSFKVVASFRDALTRQVSEAVRIEMRGQGVLNSKSEYSRCKLPRLTIDIEEWQKKKKEGEKAAKEASKEYVLEEIIDVMDDGGAAAKMIDKRKLDQEGNGRRKKKRKLEILTGWGERDENAGECGVQDDDDGDWLHGARGYAGDVDGQDGGRDQLVQPSIIGFTCTAGEMLVVLARGWVETTLLDLAWQRMLEKDDLRNVAKEYVHYDLVEGVLEKVTKNQIMKEMLFDGSVSLELENDFNFMEDQLEQLPGRQVEPMELGLPVKSISKTKRKPRKTA